MSVQLFIAIVTRSQSGHCTVTAAVQLGSLVKAVFTSDVMQVRPMNGKGSV